MPDTVRRRLAKGLGANAFNQIVTIVVQLAGVPIMLSTWGAALYGEWLMLFAIPAYFLVGDLGFSQAAGNDMAAKVAAGDQVAARSVFRSLLVVVAALSCVGLAVGACLTLLPWNAVLGLNRINSDDVGLILLVLIVEVVLRVGVGAIGAVFRATGQYAFQVFASAATRLSQFAILWTGVLLGASPLEAALLFLAARIFSAAYLVLHLCWDQKWAILGAGSVSRGEIRRLLKPALANAAIPVSQAMSVQGVVLAVGAVMGPVAVVAFSTMRTLSRLTYQVVSSVSQTSEPELAAAFGTGSQILALSLYENSQRLSIWGGLIVTCGMLLVGDEILALWTAGAISSDGVLFEVLLIGCFVSAFWASPLAVLKAANMHARATSVLAATSCVSVLAVYLFLETTHLLWLAGLPVLAVDVVMSIYCMRGAGRMLHLMPARMVACGLNPRPLLFAVKAVIGGGNR